MTTRRRDEFGWCPTEPTEGYSPMKWYRGYAIPESAHDTDAAMRNFLEGKPLSIEEAESILIWWQGNTTMVIPSPGDPAVVVYAKGFMARSHPAMGQWFAHSKECEECNAAVRGYGEPCEQGVQMRRLYLEHRQRVFQADYFYPKDKNNMEVKEEKTAVQRLREFAKELQGHAENMVDHAKAATSPQSIKVVGDAVKSAASILKTLPDVIDQVIKEQIDETRTKLAVAVHFMTGTSERTIQDTISYVLAKFPGVTAHRRKSEIEGAHETCVEFRSLGGCADELSVFLKNQITTHTVGVGLAKTEETKSNVAG